LVNSRTEKMVGARHKGGWIVGMYMIVW